MDASKKSAPLGDVVKKVIADLEKRDRDEIDILKIWEKAAGKAASKHTRLAFLKARRLVINVSDSSWLYKLALEKKKIIEKFNKNLTGKKKIRELQLRIGEIK